MRMTTFPRRRGRALILGALACLWSGLSTAGVVAAWDNFSDTWVATDGLGRMLPGAREAGPPRSDRTVGLFYFLWHGAHVHGGPYDISTILRDDPAAMQKPDSPRWGPLHVPHHWGESIFGYYRIQDDAVLRKHAQMLADAGVDVVIFDVSNQVTYREDYLALLRVWSAAREAGNRTPQVAFLTPFWDPPKVVRELWHDLYAQGRYRDLWFSWEGRPLILADPELIARRRLFADQDTPAEIPAGGSLGQAFVTDQPLRGVGGRFPTWRSRHAGLTLSLHRDGPAGPLVTRQRFIDVDDNAWLNLSLTNSLPAGAYYLEATDPIGRIGWWSTAKDGLPGGQATLNRQPVSGDRTLRLVLDDPEADAIRKFFTFRKPQPDYFQGPTQPDMWSWLEVHPQHVFTNAHGGREQMSVGVAQNAVRGRLATMSEAGAYGRSRHAGSNDLRPGAVNFGLNFSEQISRALAADPRFIFVTGWNEWIAGRFREFNGVREPVMFVDQFDQEHSRDIEPMRGGHHDHYYYQLTAFIRQYKGVRDLPALRPAAIQIDGQFADWGAVEPEYRDTLGDPVRRDAIGWNPAVRYTNNSGRNDLVAAKVSYDTARVYFQVRCREALTAPARSNWMVLFLNVDGNSTNGWLGYDFVVNRARLGSVERFSGANLTEVSAAGDATWAIGEAQLELGLPWSNLGLASPPLALDFKWADGLEMNGDWSDFTLNGDTAPNDRFNYRARFNLRRD